MRDSQTFWNSIRWRAAFLTSMVVAVVLTAIIWYAFTRATGDLVAGGTERAQTAASVLAGQTAQSAQQGLTRLQDLARDSVLRDYLRTANAAAEHAAVGVLDRAGIAGQASRIELWDSEGVRRLTTGPPADVSAPFPPSTRPAREGVLPMLNVGGEAFSHAIVAVRAPGDERPIGFVVVTRLIRSPSSSELLRKVVGNGATVLIGNQPADVAAPVWTDLENTVAAPSVDVSRPGGGEFHSGTGQRMIGAWAPIPNTPWLVLVEFPRDAIVAPAWQLLRRLIAVGLAFLVLATFAASRLSRRVTQPLGELTLAVQALERGDFSQRVLASGRDEVGQLNRAFNAMAEQIESGRRSLELRAQELAASRAVADQANQAKDDFLAVLSHELRTPLSAVLGWCHLLRAGTLSPADQARAIEVIERNAQSQLHLVNDLLDISRIVVGKFAVDLQPSDPVAVVRAVVESNQPAAERRGTSLSFDTAALNGVSPTVLFDADRLRQAVDNLVGNAIKFTPSGGHVQVAVRTRAGSFEITVRDDGEGIAPEALAHIFDRFRQSASGSKRRHAGLGLGLALAQQIVERHHGTITGESAGVGRGSTFRITLPEHTSVAPAGRRATMALAQHAGHEPNPSVAGLRVLVVEDADDSRDFLRELLTQAGALVTTAPRAAVAIQWLEDHDADAIVSDIEMPEQDGLAMLRSIRASAAPSTRHIPAIALSAYASPQDRMRSLAAGYHAHLTKPVVVAELLTTIAGAVAGRCT